MLQPGDGSSWSALSSGMGGSGNYHYVLALTVYDNKLIAGGLFTTADGVTANNIAAWDGSSWSALHAGTEGVPHPQVFTLVVYDSKLIAGGNLLTAAGGVSAVGIAAWNGSSWSALGSGYGGGGGRERRSR